MKRLVLVLGLLGLTSCESLNVVTPELPKGTAICSTPLGVARTENYQIRYFGYSTRVLLQGLIATGEDINVDASLCVFVGNTK